MSVSMLEKCAEEVANDVAPKADAEAPVVAVDPSSPVASALTAAEGDRGFDFTILIPLIMTIIQTFVEKCPQPAPTKRRLFKRPERRHDAALLAHVKSNCQCCNMTKFTLPIFNSLKARASTLPDPDATALIKECEDERNLLL